VPVPCVGLTDCLCDRCSPEFWRTYRERVRRCDRLPPEEHLPGCLCCEACLHLALVELREGRDAARHHRQLVARGRWLSQRAGAEGGTADFGDGLAEALDRIAGRAEVTGD
jgi:hypothetical protein